MASSVCDDLNAQELQTCLQSCSRRLSFNPIVREGYWQTATVRVTNTGQAMLVVIMHPQDLTPVRLISISVPSPDYMQLPCYVFLQ